VAFGANARWIKSRVARVFVRKQLGDGTVGEKRLVRLVVPQSALDEAGKKKAGLVGPAGKLVPIIGQGISDIQRHMVLLCQGSRLLNKNVDPYLPRRCRARMMGV
jgi:hypothetical protein